MYAPSLRPKLSPWHLESADLLTHQWCRSHTFCCVFFVLHGKSDDVLGYVYKEPHYGPGMLLAVMYDTLLIRKRGSLFGADMGANAQPQILPKIVMMLLKGHVQIPPNFVSVGFELLQLSAQKEVGFFCCQTYERPRIPFFWVAGPTFSIPTSPTGV